MLTDKQVLKLSKVYLRTGNIEMSSIQCGTTRKTGAKYIKLKKLPSELKQAHTWRTREDPFSDVVNELKSMHKLCPHLEAVAAFEYLQDKYPGKFKDGQLRSLQRKFASWKLDHKPEKEVYFSQLHVPGRIMQLDWTWMNHLHITINGEHFKHKICHCVLTYSNWEWAEICQSESFLSLKKGFQCAVKELGAVPAVLQTDNSSTATHKVSGDSGREFNRSYADFCCHFGVKPSTINVGKANENGDIESLNGHLKRRIEQYLILRGHRNFSSKQEYADFLKSVLRKINTNRKDKLTEELPLMQKLPAIFLPEYEVEISNVSKQSTARFKKITYSIPPKYISRTVRAHIFEDKIDVFHKDSNILILPRIHSDRGSHINYRHIIRHLIRKPGAFENYRYRDFMFPNESFRSLCSTLVASYGERRGEREYLEILHFAAKEGEKRVMKIVSELDRISSDKVRERLKLKFTAPFQKELIPDLSSYSFNALNTEHVHEYSVNKINA